METIILFAPLLGALICGFGWKFIGETAAQCVATGLLFLACILSWAVFFSFDGVTEQIPVLRYIESGTLATEWGNQTRPSDSDHADCCDDGFGLGTSL